MREIWLLDSLEGIEVTISHCLDDESLISREEEEAAALALGFASLEDHFAIGGRIERLFQHAIVIAVLLPQKGEDIRRVLRHFNVLIDHEKVLLGFAHPITLGSAGHFAEDALCLRSLHSVDVPRFLVFDLN